MPDQSPIPEKVKLRPRARILRTFGDELISSASVAVIELVKNAYDADATRVCVRFEGTATGDPKSPHLEGASARLTVVDDGIGMTPDIIKDVWMEPATSHRKRHKVSEIKKRRVLGEKGIGRFAVSQLADELTIVSRRRDTDSEVKVFFDWTWFDVDDAYLDEISVEFEVATQNESSSASQTLQQCFGKLGLAPIESLPAQGTVLEMNKLRSDWSRADFLVLQNALSRLMLPELLNAAAAGFSDFSIYLDLPAPFDDLNGLITFPETLKNPPYLVDGRVDENGNFWLQMNLLSNLTTKTSDSSCLSLGRQPQCGPFGIRLMVWDRTVKDLTALADIYGSTVKDIRRDLDSAAGVNIYRDGFRVLPYGESHYDWLRLDSRRVQNPTMRLSNNQIVGYIYISADGNPNLRDQTNREGLIDGPALNDLRTLVTCIIAVLEKKRYELRPREGKDKNKGGLFSGFNLSDVEEIIRERYPNDPQLLATVRRKQEDLAARVEEAQQVLARYRRLATLGQLMDTILHDGRQPLAKLQNEALLALKDLDTRQTSDGLVETLRRRLLFVREQGKFVADVFRKIEPFSGRKRGRPKDVILEDLIHRSFGIFDSELKRLNVGYSISDTKTACRVDESDMQQVFANLLQNSLHWLEQVSAEQRMIRVEVADRGDSQLTVIFSDSGPGVDDAVRDYIFDPYFSTKADGIGLGLTIAGEILSEYYDGSLELLDSGPLDGATFRVTINKRV